MVLSGESDAAVTGSEVPWMTFGGIELHEEIGRGGMGVVYRARQSALNRTVAVKVLLRAQFASKEERERFFRESQAAARLQHPGIVAVHEVGEDEGLPWFSMDYVPGRSLEQIVREHPMSARAAAECVRKVASAIRHAHEQGVLHRDLKPSNILIGADGEPRITDFGIARIVATETTGSIQAELTHTGQSLGSPGYAAPEQLLHGRADARTDVYGLGALLYHLLTGRPPFQGSTLEAILIQVRESDPLSPKRLNPTVPRDLETICLKCLHKSPEARYDSAQAVAEDLGRFLDGLSIAARPLGPLPRLMRWMQRHPSVAALIGAVLLLLMALVAGFLHVARKEKMMERAASLTNEARQLRANLNAGSRDQALSALREAWSIRSTAGIRNEMIAALSRHEVTLDDTIQPDDPRSRPPMPGRSADGRVHWRFEQGAVVVVETTSRKELARIGSYTVPPRAQLDDRGDRIAIAPQTNAWEPCEVVVHEVATGVVLQRYRHPHGVACMEWSGDTLATGGTLDRLVYVWDARSGERLHRFSGHDSNLEVVAFRPDGQELVSLAADYKMHVWHVGTGEEVLKMHQIGEHGAPAWWSQDGSRLFTKRKNGPQVDVFRFSWSPIARVLAPGRDEPRSENLPSVTADTTGRLSTTVDEAGCRLWDWQRGRLAGFVPKTGAEWMTACINDASGLWTSSWNQPLRRRPVTRDEHDWVRLEAHEPSALGSGPLLVSCRADGLALASTQESPDNSADWVEIWSHTEKRRVQVLQPDPFTAVLSPDGRWCITGSYRETNEALLWALPQGTLHARLPHPGNLGAVLFSPDGTKVWLWGNLTLQCLDTAKWSRIGESRKITQQTLAVSPAGDYIARVEGEKIILLDAVSFQPHCQLPLTGSSTHVSLTFSGDGRFLFAHQHTGAVTRWDLAGIEAVLKPFPLLPPG